MESIEGRTLIRISISTSNAMDQKVGAELSELINRLVLFPVQNQNAGGDTGLVFVQVETPDGGRSV